MLSQPWWFDKAERFPGREVVRQTHHERMGLVGKIGTPRGNSDRDTPRIRSITLVIAGTCPGS